MNSTGGPKADDKTVKEKKQGQGKKSGPSKISWLFFALVLVIYAVTGVISPETALKGFSIFSGLLMQIIPVLILVFFLLFLADLFIKPKKVAKYLGSESGITGWVVAIAGGIISSGPIYVWFPFLAEMQKKGMKNSLAATFLYNRAVKVPLLPLMIHYFGLTFTVVLTVYMIIFSVVVGYLTGVVVGTENKEKSAISKNI